MSDQSTTGAKGGAGGNDELLTKEEITDSEVKEYLDRASKVLELFYKGKKTLKELDATYVIEIAKMIQKEEHHG